MYLAVYHTKTDRTYYLIMVKADTYRVLANITFSEMFISTDEHKTLNHFLQIARKINILIMYGIAKRWRKRLNLYMNNY